MRGSTHTGRTGAGHSTVCRIHISAPAHLDGNRIDYILIGAGENIDGLWRTNAVSVFGQTGSSGMPPSDHYGVRAKLELVHLFGERA